MGKELICGALDEFHDLDIKEIAEKVSEARFRNPKMSAIIDSQYKQVLDKKTNEVNKYGQKKIYLFVFNFLHCLGLACRPV